jgi:hypothetical protein
VWLEFRSDLGKVKLCVGEAAELGNILHRGTCVKIRVVRKIASKHSQ